MLSIGSIFEGNYEIIAPLGEGSFGRVYKGRQRSTGQAVAIKVLRFWPGDAPSEVENQIARFRREMRLCAELSHPNIVRLIDSGESEDGILYAVFEYVPGSTLKELLATERCLRWEVARHLMIQVLDALACAHTRGMVHRDLKPANIMVTKTGAQWNAMVLDFGLGGFARDVQDWSLPRLTATRELLGTPSYAAPEQLRGESPSTRSDLYSWGLILLECLTGELVVSGKSVQEVVFRQLSPEPVAIPSAIRSGRLRRLLQKVTAKQVERRDVTIEALLQALAMIDEEELQGQRGFTAADPTAAATPSAADGERRQLTILFCDLVGSTELSTRLDPEEFREVVRSYQRTAEGLFLRFGGQVGKYLGDGVLAYFGWPKAREDDAERAVRAGLALPGAINALNEQLPPGVRLAVRVGLHTGLVVVGEDVFGETVNVAARVQQVAAPDTVVITAETHRLVAGLFVVEECGKHALRGATKSVALYRALQPSGVRSRFHARATRGLTPFVGRDEERRLLRQRFEQAGEGEGQIVLLVGEPGIGKSRLAQVLHEDLAGTPHTWLESGSTPYLANTPFYAVIELLKQFLAAAAASEPEARVGALARALKAAGLNPTEAVPLVAPLLDLALPEGYSPVLAAPEVARKRLLATLGAWVFGAARLRPMVILLEDLHWVDPSTLELQQLLVEQCATAPLLLLYTTRPEFLPPWSPRANHTQLTLNRLQRRYARELVTHVAIGNALPAEVIEAVVARTDGVPLFIEELTTAVVEAGTTAEARDIPATLADSLMARLDRLGVAKEVAQVGAVIGREFSYALLRAVSPVAEADLQASLHRLVDAELVYSRGLVPDATYRFKHALVQEAAYMSLLKSRRRDLHGTVAHVLKERFPEIVRDEPEIAAHHLAEAGEAWAAVAAWQQAAQHAVARSAHEEAVQHLRRAIALLATLPGSRDRDACELPLQLTLGSSLTAVRGFAHPETEVAYERVRLLCEGVEDRGQLASALMGLSAFYFNRRGPAQGLALAKQLLGIAEQTGEDVHLVLAHAQMQVGELYQGQFAASLAHAERVFAIYNPSGHRLLAFNDTKVGGLVLTAFALWCLGYPDQALTRARQAVVLARSLAHPFSLVYALFFETRLHWVRRDVKSAQATASELVAIGEVQGFPAALGLGRAYLAAAHAVSGTDPNAVEEISAGLALLSTGQQLGAPESAGLWAEVQQVAGNPATALQAVEWGLAVSAETGQPYWDAELQRLKGGLLLQIHPEGAAEVERLFRRALEIARAQETKSLELRAATSLAHLLRAQGKPTEARALLAPIYAWFTEGFDTRDLVEAKALLEELR